MEDAGPAQGNLTRKICISAQNVAHKSLKRRRASRGNFRRMATLPCVFTAEKATERDVISKREASCSTEACRGERNRRGELGGKEMYHARKLCDTRLENDFKITPKMNLEP